MKLLYLYIEDYGCIKEQEFIFDSNYHFHLEKKTDCLRIVEDQVIHPLPDNFWASSEGKHSVVEGVSAIIGKNGSGKTTLARFIGQEIGVDNEESIAYSESENVPKNSIRSKEKYIAIFLLDVDSHKIIISNIKDIDFKDDELELISGSMKSILLQSIKFIYYSPHYTTEHQFDSTRIIDLSTTRCLAEGPGTRIEEYQNRNKSIKISVNHVHEHYEYMNCLRLLQRNNSSIIKDIPFPKKIIIYPNRELIKIVKNELSHLMNSDVVNGVNSNRIKFQSLCSSAIQMLDNIHTNDCFIESFIYYIACYCRDFLAMFIARNESQAFFDDKIERVMAYIKFVEDLYDKLPKFPTIKNLNKSHEKILSFLCKNNSNESMESVELNQSRKIFRNSLCQEEYNLFFELENLYNNSIDNKIGEYPLLSIYCSCSEAIKVIELYYKCFSMTNFLSVKFYPHLSSGEMSFLTMFSRIYEVLHKDKEGNFILFLDEAETTLHPEWQKLLVSYLIDFLEAFAVPHRIQIIFATHSPILLSDIPNSNVVFLGKNMNGYTEVIDSKKIGNTFASNIYTLYKQSFFMSDGLMGKFAEKKINDIITQLVNLNPMKDDAKIIIEDLKNQISYIGEPVIRRQLENFLGMMISNDVVKHK